jgi:uncharacterized NAD(P)/FAD-binding protein YdhS
MKPRTIAICGNGASAALLLIALARFSDRPVKVIVLGMGDRCGAGVAYSTTNASHLLNVPAARMSADLLAPQQFQRWLEQRDVRLPKDFTARFVSRSLYADYLDQILREHLPQAAEMDVQFIRTEVQNLVRDQAGWRVVHQSGNVFADLVVLATGNDMPAPIAPRYKDIAHHIIDIPWGPLPLPPQEDVLILGSGLTAMDAVITLLDQGHHGVIHLLSRRGLIPARHISPAAGKALPRPFPTTARELTHAMRKAVGRKPPAGEWQGFMDGMRPFWPEIWQSLPLEEKERFLRHGMTHWSIHRHRLAPAMADRFEEALNRNARILKGRLTGLAPTGSASLSATITHRGKTSSLRIDRVINCTGPNSDPTKSYYPLIQNVIVSGHARSGAANLGLDVDEKNRVLDASGAIQHDLFAMGALTRGRWWEITAIPEISRQATELAGHLRAYLGTQDAGMRVNARSVE